MRKITLPAKLENLELMVRFIRNSAEDHGFNNERVNQIQIAAEEALVNVISYAYRDNDGNIEIICDAREDDSLAIKIMDWGIPFDPLSQPEPDTQAPMEEREVGGLGIYMIRNVVDEVDYKRINDRNILTLTKY